MHRNGLGALAMSKAPQMLSYWQICDTERAGHAQWWIDFTMQL